VAGAVTTTAPAGVDGTHNLLIRSRLRDRVFTDPVNPGMLDRWRWIMRVRVSKRSFTTNEP